MKITRVETIPVRVPLKPEFIIRSGRGGSHSESPFLLVRLHTDEGIVGIGEASCTPRWSGEDQVTAAHFIEAYFAPQLIGHELADVVAATERFQNAVAANYFTKAAVEMALWDLLGKSRGEPVWKLLAGSGKEESSPSMDVDSRGTYESAAARVISTKWSVSGVEPPKAAEIARWARSQGFRKMKVKVGIEPDGDVARVRAVRDAVGPDVALGVDANGGWRNAPLAIDTINRLCDAGNIYFAEQPVPAGDHEEMAEVRRKVSVPIVADESVYTLADARMLARAGAADVFSIYIGKAGGIAPARRIADFAESAGMKSTIGSNLELGVGSAAMIHLALATSSIDDEAFPCDIIGPLYYEDDVLREPLEICGGSAAVHDRPGLGVELDEDKVERYRVR
jgi:muconate cycloisomerase